VVWDVDGWLEELGLSRYSKLFAENEIDFEVLTELTEQDLKELQIPLGHRKKLLKGIAALSDNASALNPKPGTTAESPLSRPEAERRQLTVMFCDLVGSTALSERFDPEDLREIIRTYQETCARVIAQYAGYVAKYMGDGILVYFGYPQAHEDDAKRAVRAGLGIVEAITKIGENNSIALSVKLSVRVGISTGPVVVGDIVGEGAAEEASVIGETPNVAARLQALAQANQVVVSPLTRRIIGDAFEQEDMGEKLLKGIAQPVHAWRVSGERDKEIASEVEGIGDSSSLVGRQEELGLLLRAWEASKKGHGQAVLIQGEAGLGKSRLVGALLAKIKETNGRHSAATIQCSAFHAGTALYPVIEHLKRVLAWREQDTSEAKLLKIESATKAKGLPLADSVPLVANLMGVPSLEGRYPAVRFGAQELRERMLDVLTSWLLGEAENRNILCIWEDVHWADPTTLDLLALCIEQSPTVAMMNVLTFRSDFKPPWAGRSHVLPISLNRLERPEVEAMIQQRTGGKSLPFEVVDYIVDKADGVPLYVEELNKAILEADFLREGQDHYELIGRLSGVSIPATLQDLLMARLDRLPTVREVAQIGSILGREFAYEMIHAIAAHEELALQDGLDQLVEAELLYQRGRRPHARYIFKHALVQDAAYHSLLKRTRKFYHQQVGELLERRYPEIVQSQPDLVAQHYARAENNAKAMDYLIRAADKAAGLYAHAEAVTALEAALGHAERLQTNDRDRCVIEIALRLAESLHFLGRRKELVQRLMEQRARLDRIADSSLSGKLYFWLGFAHSFLGDRAETEQTLNRALEEAAQAGDKAVSGRVHRALAMECTFSGQPLEKAVDHGRQAVGLLELEEDDFWLAQALLALSYASYYQGNFDLALDAATRLNALGERSGIRRVRSNAIMMIGLTHATRGNWAAGIEAEKRALDLSPDEFEKAWILACLGKAYNEAEDPAHAIPVLEQAVELADRVRSLQFRCWFRTILADAYVLHDELDRARDVALKALQVSTDIHFLLGVGWANQSLGRIAFARGEIAEAALKFDDAIGAFDKIGARFELARTYLDGAALCETHHNVEQLRQRLEQADEIFAALQASKYVECAERLRQQLSLAVAN
jgi:class 3 adenylate cyclase/tetratricopeptide (TPR) repeat protein